MNPTDAKPSQRYETMNNTPPTDSTEADKSAGAGCMTRLVRDFDFERGEEYNELLHLINIAGSLNKGSGIVEKIKTMEAIADRLTRSDMVKPRQSFMQWLGDVAFNFHSENAEVRHGAKDADTN